MLESNPCFVPFSRDFDETQDKIATVLTVEGGEAVEGSVENLRMLYRLGVRAMTLTWNDVNSLAYPAGKRGSKKGLTALGKRVVEEMCRIGMQALTMCWALQHAPCLRRTQMHAHYAVTRAA